LDLITCLRITNISIADLRKIVELTQEGDWTIQARKEIILEHKAKLMEEQHKLDKAFKKIAQKLDYFDDLEEKYVEKQSQRNGNVALE